MKPSPLAAISADVAATSSLSAGNAAGPTPSDAVAATHGLPASAAASRTYVYDTRMPEPTRILSMSGVDYLRAVMRGEEPAAPIAFTLGIMPTEVEHGRVVFEGHPARYAYNPLGSVHGGWYATLLDSALGCAVHSVLPAGKGYTTVDLAVTFVRPITERTGKVRCEATIVHAGGSVATSQARIVDAAGTLYAHGTSTCLILSPR